MLYNKYRPSNLNKVKGQEHIVELFKTIDRKSIPHSALFIGPKGTGKTTVARIWPKLLNCLSPSQDGPCCVCENCKAIDTGYNTDVIEIDAASNNGVDHIRKLNEIVKVKSLIPNKVIIIDEIHRLTKEGFDAFLKLFEEPPENVYFVGCTTEFYKVPETIRSRGVKYFFRNINTDEIANQLEYISKEEGFEYDFDALYEIAKYAKGGLRDAISALELVCVKPINLENVRSTLGILPEEEVFSFINAVFNCDICSSIEKIDDLEQLGISNVIVDSVLNTLIDALTMLNEGKIYNTKDYIFLLEQLVNTIKNSGFLKNDLFNMCAVFSDIRGFETDALSIKCATIKFINALTKSKKDRDEENKVFNKISYLEKKINELESCISSGRAISLSNNDNNEDNHQLHIEQGQELDSQDCIMHIEGINMDIDIEDDDPPFTEDIIPASSEHIDDKPISTNSKDQNVVKTKVMSINTKGVRYHNNEVVNDKLEEVENKTSHQVDADKRERSSLKNEIFASIFER